MSPISRRILPLAAALLAACGDSTGPANDIDVALTVVGKEGPYVGPSQEGGTQVTCYVRLRAAATGHGSADWANGKWYWYAGSDRSAPIDSTSVPAAEVRESWGRPDIDAGDTIESEWTFWAAIPFRLAIEYRYIPEGESTPKRTRAEFDCGPAAAPDAAPPEITSLEVSPATGEVEASGTLDVTYAAHSPVGLWSTAVELSGPCELRREFASENLAESVTRTVTLELPPACRLGEPISVRVGAVDGIMVSSEREEATGIVVVDRTSPTLSPQFLPPTGGVATAELAGDYFVGDSIRIVTNARDNHEVAAVVWEVLPFGVVDSIVVNASEAPVANIPLRPEWVGELHLRLLVRDRQGLTSEVVTTTPAAVTVRPTVERLSRSRVVQGEIRNILVDERRGVVHLLQANERRVTTLDAATLDVLSSAGVTGATDFDLTPSGDSIVLALPDEGALGVLDLTRPGAPLSLIRLVVDDPSIARIPSYLGVAANGKVFVVTYGGETPFSEVVEVDLTTGSQRVREDAGQTTNIIARSLDHGVIVAVGDTSRRYDAAMDAFGAPEPTIMAISAPTLDRTGHRMATGLDVYDESLELLRRIESPWLGGTRYSVISADGAHLFQHHPTAGLIRASTVEGTLVDRTPIPFAIRPTALRVSPGGGLLVMVESDRAATSTIGVIDLR
ncbi:MAG TPA: hypothetical protein VFZ11_03200 [Gemmatimonadaceae bacterium]